MPSQTKIIPVSTHLHNCAFHSLLPFVLQFVSPKSKEATDFSFSRTSTRANDLQAFKKTTGYQYFLQAFAEYYDCPFNQAEDKLTWLHQQHSHPLDLQVMLGPVLRQTLAKVLLNHAAHAGMINVSFEKLLQDCKHRFQCEVPQQHRANPSYVADWLAQLKLAQSQEFDELFIPNKDIIALYLLSGATTNQTQFVKQHGNKAFQQYVAYQSDDAQGAYVSLPQLEMLCHSFSFNFSVSGHQNAPKKGELAFKPLANVILSNKSKSHWEIVANPKTQWDFSANQSAKLTHFYNQLQAVLDAQCSPSHIALMQNTLKDEIKKCLQHKKTFEQPVYAVLPTSDWAHNSGAAPFAQMLTNALKAQKNHTNKTGILSTQGFSDFLEHFRGYYRLNKTLSHKELTDKLYWLLATYPHPKEQFMIITPVLRSMLNQADLIPTDLSISDLVRLCECFELNLNIYCQSEEDTRISCFHKVFSHKRKAQSKGLIELSFDNKRFYQIEKNEVAGYKEAALRQAQPNHGFNLIDKADALQKTKLKILQDNLSEALQTGLPYIDSTKGTRAQLQAPSSQVKTTSTQLNNIIAALQKDNATALKQTLQSNKISANQVLLSKPHTLGVSVSGHVTGWTLLHYAVYFGAKKCTKALIEQKANWQQSALWEVTDNRLKTKLPKTKWQVSALELAACLNQRDILSYLLGQINTSAHKQAIQSAYQHACSFRSTAARQHGSTICLV